MRGGFLHNKIMAAQLDREFRRFGCHTRNEVHVVWNGGSGFIDLVGEHGGLVVAIEIERTTHRVHRDLLKAAAIQATELWIVGPDQHICRSFERTLQRLQVRIEGVGIFVLTFGQAVQRVSNCFSLISASNVPGKQTTRPERNSSCGSSGPM